MEAIVLTPDFHAIKAFDLPECVLGAARYGRGHINDTCCVVCQPREGNAIRFILQGLSTTAFSDPHALMENFVGITSFLRVRILQAGGDPERETLSLIKTTDGKDYYTDPTGKVWRMMPFIEGTDCLHKATPELFEASARAFGKFQKLLQSYPAEKLHETIPKFHDTEDRFDKFMRAVREDRVGRAQQVQAEILFATERKEDCSVLMKAYREGKLPLRVTHNDTKLNNLLIDRITGEGICVIDLDTTMPGFSVNDFGDSIRFGANRGGEDEINEDKIAFDIDLYEAYTRGFLVGASGVLTASEIEYLPWGARLMTLECGIRFLTDYLDGDLYFHADFPEQNLIRARSQFKLVRDMEAQFEQMCAIVRKYV